MAWDFSTDPDFQEQLDWMAQFVRDEIWPLETLVEELDQAALDRIYEPLQQRVKERGLWAAHLDADLGGQGFGQLKLGLMHEILGTSPFAPNAFGCQAPDSGNSEILALAGTNEQKERWLHPLLAAVAVSVGVAVAVAVALAVSVAVAVVVAVAVAVAVAVGELVDVALAV